MNAFIIGFHFNPEHKQKIISSNWLDSVQNGKYSQSSSHFNDLNGNKSQKKLLWISKLKIKC